MAKNCTSTNHLPDKLDICASGNVAVYLKTKVATHQYHKIYFDNFCMPVPIMLYPYGTASCHLNQMWRTTHMAQLMNM